MSTMPESMQHSPQGGETAADPSAENPWKVNVTEWTVGLDSDGNLNARCLVTPEEGVTISFLSLGVYENTPQLKPIVFGGGGLNTGTGTGDEWGALAGGAGSSLKGQTVVSQINGQASSTSYGFYFRKTFQL